MLKHRHSVKDFKRLHGIYHGIKKRCYNPNEPRYKDYGGRGIVMCGEWLDRQEGFDRFVDWALANGYKDDLTIDRIDVNGNYAPANCRWITLAEQRLNCRDTRWVEYKGERIQLIKLCDRMGLSYDTVHDRLYKRGWDLERALTEPSQLVTSFAKKCRSYGMNPSLVKDRIKLGWSEEEAITTPPVGRAGGAALAGRRKGETKCKRCGSLFLPRSAGQIYCSAECREADKRDRRKVTYH